MQLLLWPVYAASNKEVAASRSHEPRDVYCFAVEQSMDNKQCQQCDLGQETGASVACIYMMPYAVMCYLQLSEASAC